MALSDVVGRLSGLAAGAGGVALRQLQRNRVPGAGGASVREDPARSARRWRAVTILCTPERIGTGDVLPAPLAPLSARIEVTVTPASGDRGTVLAARFRDRPGEQDVGRLRAALRETKQLIEVGEVLRNEPQPHGTRKETPQGRALDGMAARAAEEGVL